MTEAAPAVIVLAGPNGAGKTTCARTLLAETLKVTTFVNADVIAQGLCGFDPESSATEASRIMLQRLHALAEQHADFAFETTLAGRTYGPWLKSLHQEGYLVHLVYLWLASADLAVARVTERVRRGGHSIPEATTRQRYERSTENFFLLYQPIANSWKVFDNSGTEPQLVAQRNETGLETVAQKPIWTEMLKRRSHA